jgi:serine protease inhibitor
MKTLFSEQEADFSGIAKTDENLFVSKLIQKAFLRVEEQGSEAGAATYGNFYANMSERRL